MGDSFTPSQNTALNVLRNIDLPTENYMGVSGTDAMLVLLHEAKASGQDWSATEGADALYKTMLDITGTKETDLAYGGTSSGAVTPGNDPQTQAEIDAKRAHPEAGEKPRIPGGQGEVRDPNDGRLKENRDQGIKLGEGENQFHEQEVAMKEHEEKKEEETAES
jgi:hypothetical protein